MAWDSTPPTPEEMKAAAAPRWDATPPTPEELKAAEPYKGNPDNISFGDVATESIPIVGPLANKAGLKAAAYVRGFMGKENRPVDEVYERLKAEDAADRKAYAEQKPTASMGAGMLGTFMTPIPKVGVLGQAAYNTAVMGADAYARDKDPLAAGGIAGAATLALGGAGKMVGSSKALKSYAERRAVKAAGGMTKEMRDLGKAGFLQDTGRELLDKKIVTVGASLEDVAERAAAGREEAGKKIGDAIGKVDDLVADTNKMIDDGKLFAAASPAEKEAAKKYLAENFQFNMNKIGQRIRSELVAPDAANPLLGGEMSKLNKIAEGFEAQAPQTLRQGLGIKKSQRRITNFNSDTIPQEYKQDLYKIIKEELENSVGKTNNLTTFNQFTGQDTPQAAAEFLNKLKTGLPGNAPAGSPADAFKAANREYAIMANTENMAQKRMGAKNSNRENSLSDVIAESAGLLHGGITGAAALGALNKGVRRYGSSVGAVGADKIGDLLAKTPEVFGKYGAMLQKAAAKGNASLALTHYLLMKDDPEYRQLFGNTGN